MLFVSITFTRNQAFFGFIFFLDFLYIFIEVQVTTVFATSVHFKI